MTGKARTRWCASIMITVLLTCTSCARFERVASPELTASDLVGRNVRVTTTDGRVLEFTIQAVMEDALVGSTERVPFNEIARLEQREVSVWKTVAVAVGGVAVVATVAFVVFLVEWIGVLSGS
jgi:hypothetical protein